jgi:hypothetical protein
MLGSCYWEVDFADTSEEMLDIYEEHTYGNESFKEPSKMEFKEGEWIQASHLLFPKHFPGRASLDRKVSTEDCDFLVL